MNDNIKSHNLAQQQVGFDPTEGMCQLFLLFSLDETFDNAVNVRVVTKVI